jgi:SAM-dependent methyltransferase
MAEITDKTGVLQSIEGRTLELGCGQRKRDPSHVGVDVLDYPGVDLLGDVFDVLEAIPDSSLAGVYTSHFMEHISDMERLIVELARVIRPDGRLDVVVPHFSNPYYYSDLTHTSPFGLYTFSYWALDPLLRRRVPTYQRELAFELRTVRLRFKSPPPFVVRYALKRVFEVLVNLSVWTQEFYEENLSQIVPCYELEFGLLRRRG